MGGLVVLLRNCKGVTTRARLGRVETSLCWVHLNEGRLGSPHPQAALVRFETKMIRSMITLIVFLAFSILTGCAQSMPRICNKISWQANTEPDLQEYRVVVWKGDSAHEQSSFVVPASKTELNCQKAGITGSGEWYAKVQACNLSGNCSQFSESILITIPKEKP